MNTFIKIRPRELFDIFFELIKQMFRNITNETIKTMSKKRKIIASSKTLKKKKMHVNLIRFNSTKSMHLKEIVIRVVFLCFMYIVVYSTMNVMIEDIKTKTMFNNKIEINCIFKRLIDVAQLLTRQEINIIIITIINEQTHFFDVYKMISINIENVIVSISVFIVKRLNYELFFKRFFQRAVCINFININNKFFKMILHSLNEKKKINFLNVFIEHVSNKDEKLMIVMKYLNV